MSAENYRETAASAHASHQEIRSCLLNYYQHTGRAKVAAVIQYLKVVLTCYHCCLIDWLIAWLVGMLRYLLPFLIYFDSLSSFLFRRSLSTRREMWSMSSLHTTPTFSMRFSTNLAVRKRECASTDKRSRKREKNSAINFKRMKTAVLPVSPSRPVRRASHWPPLPVWILV